MAAEPLIRSQIGTIERVLARSGVWTKLESGTTTPLMFSVFSTTIPGSLKRSSQTTSLATSRSACEARSAPAAAASFDPCVRRNASESPARPLTRKTSASSARSCASCSGPGGSSLRARRSQSSCCWARPELLLQLGGLDSLGRERVAELAADARGVVATAFMLVM